MASVSSTKFLFSNHLVIKFRCRKNICISEGIKLHASGGTLFFTFPPPQGQQPDQPVPVLNELDLPMGSRTKMYDHLPEQVRSAP